MVDVITPLKKPIAPIINGNGRKCNKLYIFNMEKDHLGSIFFPRKTPTESITDAMPVVQRCDHLAKFCLFFPNVGKQNLFPVVFPVTTGIRDLTRYIL